MKKKRQLFKAECENCADAIQSARLCGRDLAVSAEMTRAQLETLQRNLETLLNVSLFNGTEARVDLVTLAQRVARLIELRNQMELGSFQIQINRVMQSAWEVLP